jgi:hypothetical protein
MENPTPKKNHRVLLVFLFLSFISLGTTIAILQSKLDNNNSLPNQILPQQNLGEASPTITQPATNPHQATLQVNTLSPTSTSIILSQPSFDLQNLTAYQLEITFNPKAIKVLSLTPGNIWPQTSLLSQQTNNQTGLISISIGKGFNTKATSNSILLTINHQAIDSNLTPDIKILTNSKLAISGYSTSVQISVE